MKIASRFVVVISLGLGLTGSVFADSSSPQPQPCDSSWSACAVGRADFDNPGSGDIKGKFLIDMLFASQPEITANVPLIGDGALGGAEDGNPYLRAYVEPGGVDVMIEAGSQPGQTQSFAIGKLSAPIGTDDTVYYTREVSLNPGVKITEGPTQTTKNRYCDQGGVFGAVIYNEQFSDTNYVITGATPEPFNYHVQRMLITSSYPAIFGCGN